MYTITIHLNIPLKGTHQCPNKMRKLRWNDVTKSIAPESEVVCSEWSSFLKTVRSPSASFCALKEWFNTNCQGEVVSLELLLLPTRYEDPKTCPSFMAGGGVWCGFFVVLLFFSFHLNADGSWTCLACVLLGL